jgi:hypothetical protein
VQICHFISLKLGLKFVKTWQTLVGSNFSPCKCKNPKKKNLEILQLANTCESQGNHSKNIFLYIVGKGIPISRRSFKFLKR